MSTTPGSNGSVHKVTISDVYYEIQDLRASIDAYQVTVLSVDDHERRLRMMERLVWMALGIATALPIAMAVFVA